MSPKPSPDTEELIKLFKAIGLSQAKAAEAAKSPKSAATLRDLVVRHDLAKKDLGEKQATLMAALAVSSAKLEGLQRDYIVSAVLDGKLKSVDQVNASVKYLETRALPVDENDFNKSCGVGFSISQQELHSVVTRYIQENTIVGWANLNQVIGELKATDLRWANALEVKNSVERVFTESFGPKQSGKLAKVYFFREPKRDVPKNVKAAEAVSTSARSVFEEGFLGKLHKPGGNSQIKPELREAHLKATGGQVWTRFPPEPNGFLHIGHSKAIFVNFGYAAHHGGRCYLRYDDTNPEAEEAIYFEKILEMVRWLGFEPWKITYSSDYFDQLYELAVELIRRDKAYICHCTGEEIHAHRGGDDGGARVACVHRARPISESLVGFENMKNGKYKPGEVTLRMKQDLEDGNPQMWDLIAYRVLLAPHHRTGDKWIIYPTYDFTHCLVDSFENISHSLCTVEFILSRVSYEWLCDALEVYKPRQSEYGRLNIQGTVMSKRKILALVKEGYVIGWDDPRLYTLIALRRRGIPPGAIISFVSTLGVSTSPSNIQLARFDQSVRSYLENSAPRLLMVLRPLKVTIENLPEDYLLVIEKPLHPKVPALGTTKLLFSRTVYIDRDDFRLEDSPDYFRLAPGKAVGLYQAPYPIVYVSHRTDPDTGEVVEVVCRLEDGSDGKPIKRPKVYIQWVAEHAASGSPIHIDETRIFHQLFKSDNPAAAPDFRADVNPDSLEVIKGAVVEVGFYELAKRAYLEAKRESTERTAAALKENTGVNTGDGDTPKITSGQLIGPECVRFQGLRTAFFALDNVDAKLAVLDEADNIVPGRRDGDCIVLNRIVSLKEDAGKTA
ncbi:glutaminyl-tRNA synthetase [Vararia minispora EC-137]|uniref:Glutaminyl-tRNA synthetase n=1 Tax=Vararia minispora EC-137 TaxID=1314806 RepID=A0ACB8QJ85_9AGAM|nr:glutaminyl-tRNA synthetase [Vararia minispora EC-137]